jgi:hypothetical protein
LPFVSCEPNSFRVLQLHVPACTKCSRVCKHTRPQVGSIGPIGTLSVEATIAGSCMYIYGGWCHRGLPDSLLQLQLGLEPSELPDEKAHQPYVFLFLFFRTFTLFFELFHFCFCFRAMHHTVFALEAHQTHISCSSFRCCCHDHEHTSLRLDMT